MLLIVAIAVWDIKMVFNKFYNNPLKRIRFKTIFNTLY